jgi:hypothetical protein
MTMKTTESRTTKMMEKRKKRLRNRKPKTPKTQLLEVNTQNMKKPFQ